MDETPSIKNMKVFVTIESVLEVSPRFSIAKIFDYLRSQKFGGDTHVNCNQGGITNVVTREHIPVTMAELDHLLHERQQ
jgi:hypothetical protein